MWSNVKTFKLTFQMCHSCVKEMITNDTAPQHSSLISVDISFCTKHLDIIHNKSHFLCEKQ